MRRLVTAIAMAIALVTLGGCGSSASTADKKDVEAIVANLSKGSSMSRKDASCIADATAQKISTKGLKAATKKNGDLSDLPKADQTIVFKATTTCVPVDRLAGVVADAFNTGQGSNSESAKCFSSALEDRYKSSGDLMRAMFSGAKEMREIATKCLSSDSLKAALVEAVAQGGGVTKDQATCAIDKLFAQMTPDEQKKLATEGPSSDLQTKLTTALQECLAGK